jgi:hypothetical protein
VHSGYQVLLGLGKKGIQERLWLGSECLGRSGHSEGNWAELLGSEGSTQAVGRAQGELAWLGRGAGRSN